jgi:hypothetical protein
MLRTTHAFSQGDLFHNFDLKQFQFKEGAGTFDEMRKKYKHESKEVLIAKIFWAFMKLIFKDMVNNGITFHLPTQNIAMFTWVGLSGDVFTKAYQSGKFDEIDFLSTNFTLYLPIFKYFYRGKFKERSFILDKNFQRVIIDKVNKGYKYC